MDQDYFDAAIKPMLDPSLVEFVGEIGGKAKEEFLGNAFALLFPIDWPEPFGLVMIEAMACGTPGDRVATRLRAGNYGGRRHWFRRPGNGGSGARG